MTPTLKRLIEAADMLANAAKEDRRYPISTPHYFRCREAWEAEQAKEAEAEPPAGAESEGETKAREPQPVIAAREAVDAFRDFARALDGHMDFKTRDRLVAAIHDGLDSLLEEVKAHEVLRANQGKNAEALRARAERAEAEWANCRHAAAASGAAEAEAKAELSRVKEEREAYRIYADNYVQQVQEQAAELAKLKKLVEAAEKMRHEAVVIGRSRRGKALDDAVDLYDAACGYLIPKAEPQEQPVSKEPAPLDLKVQADAMRGHAWLRRFRQGNNSLSGMACKDIAGYVDRLLDLCGACPWIDPTPEPAPEPAAPSFKVGQRVRVKTSWRYEGREGVIRTASAKEVDVRFPSVGFGDYGETYPPCALEPLPEPARESAFQVGQKVTAAPGTSRYGQVGEVNRYLDAERVVVAYPDCTVVIREADLSHAPHPVDEQTNSPEIPDSSTAGLLSHISAVEAVSQDRLVTIMGLKADLSQTKGYLGIANARIAELEAELAKRAEKPANPFNQGNWPETKTYNVEPNPADVRRSIVTEQPDPNPFNRGDWPEAKTYEVPKPAPTLSEDEREMLTFVATGPWREEGKDAEAVRILSRLALEQERSRA